MGHNRLVQLRPFTRTDLPITQPWFQDDDTQRYLGGYDWPEQMLDLGKHLVGTEFRGAIQTGVYRYLAESEGRPVGYIDCGTFDRWTTYAGEGPDGPVITESIELPAGAIAFVVDPVLRGQGVCRDMITALMARPELAFIRVFGAGVEPENLASIRCLQAAGFRSLSSEPDFEGTLYLLFQR